MQAVVYSEPYEVERRLKQLDIPVEALVRAAQAGHTALVTRSPNDPPSLPGTNAWGHTVRAVRDELLAIGGWRKDDPGNFSLTINDELGINIYVSSGDMYTGREPPYRQPKTKSPKGLYAEAAIKINTAQGDLFGNFQSDLVRKAITLGHPTWFYLVYITDDEIRAELSFPDDFMDNEVSSWKERIIIRYIGTDPGVINTTKDFGPDFDVPVLRKK
ncbi:hypothetical protein [Methylorubrum sp. SB2]|uniref:hypothetical protein n=1 Tax=Methylorubrum subtropicum TaxID=3138812 RepID=UPI00313C0D91